MRKRSDLKMYSHERVLYKTHVTLNQISDKWDMYKTDLLDEVANILLQFDSFEEFEAAIERGKEAAILERLDTVMSIQANACPLCRRGFEDCECMA